MWRFFGGFRGRLWRGSLLPLDSEAVPMAKTPLCQKTRLPEITTAARPSGSKLPRHKSSL
ncbi:hypothetical protein EB795_22280 [Pseudomonas mandelii]|nr:hypothetical protein [Pseudomonas mandelii]